ncbi:MAG: response regulator [Succinivibrio sp.]|nr:response regulator [Succinivibrio sp.]
MIDLENVNILIVDDDELMLSMAREMLVQRLPYKVHVAGSGAECLSILGRKTPHIDLILMDVYMPGMDGFQTLTKVRQLHGYEKVPTVLLTAASDRDTVANALKMKVSGYIKKPFFANQLAEKVATVIMNEALGMDDEDDED